jgi:hypothetical protein
MRFGVGRAIDVIKRILALGAVALLAGAAARFFTASSPANARPAAGASPLREAIPAAPPAAGHPHWTAMWTRQTPGLCSVSLSLDGSTVAWVDGRGVIRRLSGAAGDTLYQTPPTAGVNSVLAVSGGSVIAYSALNPLDRTIIVLDGASGSARTQSFVVNGPIWSVIASNDGQRALVGTGGSELVVLSIAPPPHPATASAAPAARPATPLRIRTDGIPTSSDYAPRAGLILAGTASDAGVGAWGLDGAPRWRHNETQVDRTYAVSVSADGKTAVAVSSRRPHGTEARVHVWDGHTGRLIWNQDLAASDARAMVSAEGDTIAISYALPAPGQSARDDNVPRKIVAFDRSGHRLFAPMGGVFFAPVLAALSTTGQRITVRDKAGYLWTLDNRGHILSRVRLPADKSTGEPPKMVETAASDDGTCLLVRRGDGQLTFFKATAL